MCFFKSRVERRDFFMRDGQGESVVRFLGATGRKDRRPISKILACQVDIYGKLHKWNINSLYLLLCSGFFQTRKTFPQNVLCQGHALFYKGFPACS